MTHVHVQMYVFIDMYILSMYIIIRASMSFCVVEMNAHFGIYFTSTPRLSPACVSPVLLTVVSLP